MPPNGNKKRVTYQGCGFAGDWIAFEEAREYIHSLNLPNVMSYRKWAKSSARLLNIPTNPDASYQPEWINWLDWLGKPPVNRCICGYAIPKGLMELSEIFAFTTEKNRQGFIKTLRSVNPDIAYAVNIDPDESESERYLVAVRNS